MDYSEEPYPGEKKPVYVVDLIASKVIERLSKDGHVNEDGAIIYKGKGGPRTGSDVLELVNYHLGRRSEGRPIDYRIFVEQYRSYF